MLLFPFFSVALPPPAPSESPPGNTKRNDHPRLPPLRFSVHPRVTFWSIPQKGDFTPLHVLVGPFINRPAPAHLHISDPPQKKNDWLQEKEKKKRETGEKRNEPYPLNPPDIFTCNTYNLHINPQHDPTLQSQPHSGKVTTTILL